MSKFYLTTAISYVNAPPHIGHALEFIQADALCRYHRLKGDDTYFLTGTDEHGVKIYETAKEKGQETQALVDENAEKFRALKDILGLSYDDFIRTTDDRHKAGARKIWTKIANSGDIYKGVYKGNYCVGCESFIPDKDLDENGNCAIHKKVPKLLEEENYFFKLSKYSDQIRDLIQSDKLKVVPETRKNEMLNIIGEEGLKDVSFSRPKSVLPWGIDVPGDETQVMYVWCDALSNYITALDYVNEGELYKKYWPCDVHLIGKDILRFHAGIWIGMLLSAGEKVPKSVCVHGFVTCEGEKMSKSIGNVVDPLEYVDNYGLEALRYYLLREIPSADDGDFSQERFKNVFNSELANSLGNLVNRVTMMTEKYLDGKVPAPSSGVTILPMINDLFRRYEKSFENFDIKDACECTIELANFANKYIDDKKPWVLSKDDPDALPGVMYDLLEILRFLAILFVPILPSMVERVCQQLELDPDSLKLEAKWGQLKEGSNVKSAGSLFPRIEEG